MLIEVGVESGIQVKVEGVALDGVLEEITVVLVVEMEIVVVGSDGHAVFAT